MRFDNLNDWLNWQERLHPSEIDLGLDRVRQVASRLENRNIFKPAPTVIIVGGTNGKGSTVAMLDAIYRAAGYHTGCYTSPHLLRYNERITIDGIPVDDQTLCQSFARIDSAIDATRVAADVNPVSLTYFEFGTLAALDIIDGAQVDVAILEVGLGGRLDAVNIVDPDLSIITSIGIDHVAWLGHTRDQIAGEKLGIARDNRPLIIGEIDPPARMREIIDENHWRACFIDQDYHCDAPENFNSASQWNWHSPEKTLNSLPLPALRGEFQLRNASTALQAVQLLSGSLPVTQGEIKQGLLSASLPGRMQSILGNHQYWLDTAHNEQATQAIADLLGNQPDFHSRYAVVGMLNDKLVADAIRPLLDVIDNWYCCNLHVDRDGGAEALARELNALGVEQDRIKSFDTVAEALATLEKIAATAEALVFGSFHTVAQATVCLEQMNSDSTIPIAGSLDGQVVGQIT